MTKGNRRGLQYLVWNEFKLVSNKLRTRTLFETSEMTPKSSNLAVRWLVSASETWWNKMNLFHLIQSNYKRNKFQLRGIITQFIVGSDIIKPFNFANPEKFHITIEYIHHKIFIYKRYGLNSIKCKSNVKIILPPLPLALEIIRIDGLVSGITFSKLS
jgi:intein/homing endonuclease